MQMEMLGIASQSVDEYEEKSEPWKKDYQDLEDCWKCEDWISCGLETYKTISSVDSVLHKGAEQGKFDLTHHLQDLIILTYESWLKHSDDAEKWIESLTTKEQRPKNADDMLIAINAARTLISGRRARRQKIDGVNSAKLKRLAQDHRPPNEWFEGKDEY